MNLNKEAKKIILTSKYKQQLEMIIDLTKKEMSRYNIEPTNLQWTILINHLNEMILRSNENKEIPKVDSSMFSEVSEEALNISEYIVDTIGNLQIDEKYVLSIHFESAKQN